MRKILQYSIYLFAIIGFILTAGFFAVTLGITNSKSLVIDTQREAFLGKPEQNQASIMEKSTQPDWVKREEWVTFKEAITKDRDDIYKVSAVTDVPSRLIVAQVAVEQMRLFYTNRDLFKKVFSPLKILGNQSQFSWGVAGIKQETAVRIEENLINTSSPFYPGENYSKLLAFTTSDHDTERFERIVNEDSRYYSYLYTAIFLKEVEAQWEKAGFSIKNNAGVLSTLFNIGFQHSLPNNNPKIGGSEIDMNGKKYSFGSLAKEFYESDELLDIFPRK